ncbi:integron integrase [Permianibacter sp. IMCC34836]|uniref:integron integrase n=1 Tax=Permianibacter fluminis TaxID=2738515 RepID=UPI001552E29D|nr:integron integrase [Permianibacter fluminis]NQD38577.1 integron integrase [Permianibacter fluminis]
MAQKLMDQVVEKLRVEHYSLRTEKTYCHWIRRFILFHRKRHPAEMGKYEVEQFLSALAVKDKVSASTQNQALAALLFLYRKVLSTDLPWLDDVVRARRTVRIPVVLSPSEVRAVIQALPAPYQLMVQLLYGAGLRRTELLSLRVKDVDMGLSMLTVREGKGGKDRVVPLPQACRSALTEQLRASRLVYEQDRAQKLPGVVLPWALEKKYPKAGETWAWHWLFPQAELSRDPRTGITRRHHFYPQTLSRALARAVAGAGINKLVRCHTFRHSFATHLLQSGTDIRTIQTLLGHSHVETTMIYTHVAKVGAGAVSPLDRL